MTITKFKIAQARERAFLTVSKQMVLNGETYSLWDIVFSEHYPEINGWNPDAEEILTIPCDNLTVKSSRRIAVYTKN